MELNMKILWGVFLCLLGFQASVIMSYAHSKGIEATTRMPEVRMGDESKEAVAENGSDWDDSHLLKIRNAFEAKLLPALNKKATQGEIPSNTMWRVIEANFVENNKVSKEDARKVADMMHIRIEWLADRVSKDVRRLDSTSKKYEQVAGNPYRTQTYAELPIPGGDSGEWGRVSDYVARRVQLRLMGVAAE